MSRMLKVTAECVYATTSSPYGLVKQLVMKGALIPADCPEAAHLLGAGMVAELAPPPAPIVAAVVEADPAPNMPVKAPHLNASTEVWADFAVGQGLDRAEVEKILAGPDGKKTVRDLLSS